MMARARRARAHTNTHIHSRPQLFPFTFPVFTGGKTVNMGGKQRRGLFHWSLFGQWRLQTETYLFFPQPNESGEDDSIFCCGCKDWQVISMNHRRQKNWYPCSTGPRREDHGEKEGPAVPAAALYGRVLAQFAASPEDRWVSMCEYEWTDGHWEPSTDFQIRLHSVVMKNDWKQVRVQDKSVNSQCACCFYLFLCWGWLED